MVLYKQLTLTGLSLINNGVEQLMEEKLEWVDHGHTVPGSGGAHVYLSDDIQNTLSSELLDQLQSIDLTPAVIVNFSEHGKTYETPVHNDLTLYNNNNNHDLAFNAFTALVTSFIADIIGERSIDGDDLTDSPPPPKSVPAITVSLSFNLIAPSGPVNVRLPYPGDTISSAF